KLAPHVAELAGFGVTVLTTRELDFSKGSSQRVAFESANQLVRVFDEGAAKVRAAMKDMPDAAWTENWKLSFQGKPIFSGSRFLAYRQMFLNHLVHHRAQLGVYLRLNDKPLPATYGPSADDTMGFSSWLCGADKSARPPRPTILQSSRPSSPRISPHRLTLL